MISKSGTESGKALVRAADAIRTAEYDLAGNFPMAAVNRTYYASYYCMTALLFSKNIFAKTHHGTRAKFSELFIKTGVFPESMAIYIKIAFDLRQEADYDFDADITVEEAENIIIKFKEFYQFTIAYLQKTG